MPYVSQAQAGYFHTHKAELEKQGVNVDEWDAATKGKHLPKRVGHYAKGGTVAEAEYARGGAAREGDTRWTKKDPQGRGKFGRFLGTEDRFTDGRVQDNECPGTDENWTKKGDTMGHEIGDSKCLKPILPRK